MNTMKQFINCGKEKYICKNKVAALNSFFNSKQIQRMKKTYQKKKRKKKGGRVKERGKDGNKGLKKWGIFKVS